jgi:hypothetical protein
MASRPDAPTPVECRSSRGLQSRDVLPSTLRIAAVLCRSPSRGAQGPALRGMILMVAKRRAPPICARQADAQTDPKLKQDFLDMERRWLALAQSYQFGQSLTDFSKREANVPWNNLA